MKMFKENKPDFFDNPPPKNVMFKDKSFCLTGHFNDGNKKEYGQKIKDQGGIIHDQVTKKTDYLVAGSKGNERYDHDSSSNSLARPKDIKIMVRQFLLLKNPCVLSILIRKKALTIRREEDHLFDRVEG